MKHIGISVTRIGSGKKQPRRCGNYLRIMSHDLEPNYPDCLKIVHIGGYLVSSSLVFNDVGFR